MLSNQDKQAILNGSYAVTRRGQKAKYIGKRDSKDYPHSFILYNEKDEIRSTFIVSEEMQHDAESDSQKDIVGLWVDKPEPFDLSRALAGEPVMLRCGRKAFILGQIPNPLCFDLVGYIEDEDGNSDEGWRRNGLYMCNNSMSDNDVIGMWREPTINTNTVTLTLPCPVETVASGRTFFRITATGNIAEESYSAFQHQK